MATPKRASAGKRKGWSQKTARAAAMRFNKKNPTSTRSSAPAKSGGLPRPPSMGVPQWDLFRGIGDALKKVTGGKRSAPKANARARQVASARSAVQRGISSRKPAATRVTSPSRTLTGLAIPSKRKPAAKKPKR